MDRLTIHGPSGLDLHLDRNQVNGGTPAIVRTFGYNATLTCALHEGSLTGPDGERSLTRKQMDWLSEVSSPAEDFLDGDSQAPWRLFLKADRI